jgi:hypothetical protein
MGLSPDIANLTINIKDSSPICGELDDVQHEVTKSTKDQEESN